MNAAGVLTDARRAWRVSYDPAEHENVDLDAAQVAALLAHGEQGVAILPDGTLCALSGSPSDPAAVRAWLVPVSAEAGDTDARDPVAFERLIDRDGDTDG